MDEVDAGSLREPRQQHLLTADPLHAIGRPNGYLDLFDQLSPRAWPGVAVDERREPRSRRCRCHERRNRLARRNLHTTGFARDEKDQIEPYVHGSGPAYLQVL